MNKFLVGFLVVLAGGLFGWYFLKGTPADVLPNNQVPTPEITNAVDLPLITPADSTTKGGVTVTTTVSPVVATARVTYNTNGFSPEKITVKKGAAVSFTNQSSGTMWVASDVHPTHQLLPGFDQLKAEAKGTSYSYTFSKVGTWTYHNHVSSTHVGTVVVTE